MKWTEDQQKVIDTRGCNILVSAAAGSGKTAVLVARILALITQGGANGKPVDIDRLLVVTFTNAAAAEMRERIRDALERRAEEEPDNEHLQRQLVLVHNAKITTIHSFCLQVLRSHFQTVGIDPAFRVADEGEMLLLEQDTAKETVDAAYERAEESFHEFLEVFTTGKSDRALEAAVLQLYHFALGQPWPREWLRECRERYRTDFRGPERAGERGPEPGQAGQAAPAQTGTDRACADGLEAQTGTDRVCADGPERDQAGQEVPAPECEGADDPAWLSYLVEETARLLGDVREQIEEALRIAQEPDGPYPYIGALMSDLELLDKLEAGTDYESYAQAFAGMGAFARLGTKKDGSISEEKKAQVQRLRNDAKEALAGIRKNYYYDRTEVLREEFAASGLIVRVLTELAEDFMERLAQQKASQNLVDFGDLEHLALRVLVERRDGEAVPTAAAMEYAEAFEEIMIDEYQDSNLVQELILNSVSGRGSGAHNLFMVGDVKQSIYRFRLARPELFMEKYRTYREAGDAACRIDLHRNFRSREQVLGGVNFLFRQIMTEHPGGVVYDRDAALYPGADFSSVAADAGTVGAGTGKAGAETGMSGAGAGTAGAETGMSGTGTGTASAEAGMSSAGAGTANAETGLVGTGTDTVGAGAAVPGAPESSLATELWLMEASGRERQKREAGFVGRRIREIVGHMPVRDAETGASRPAGYGDIVILLRTVSGWAETFGEVLTDMGIPCVTGSQKGYFSTAEIRTVLSYLQILDNPVQDIPLAAVLRSAIGGFSDEDLAEIRVCSDRRYFYDCCQEYRASGKDGELRERLERFFAVYERLRAKSAHTPVHRLLWELLDVTGYGEYAAALPAGRQRQANLDMLVEKAIAYEATSYRGLYHFVRYIENLKKYEVDYGEANVDSEAGDVVRIMSIHKSKGLEFPIVFVSGLGKQFNESESRSRIVMHPEFGTACDFVDARNRTRRATLLKQAIRQRNASEGLGEEMRVLYVAMTRAREKLILTGCVPDIESREQRWQNAAAHRDSRLSYACLSSASDYLDWIMPALMRHPASGTLFPVMQWLGEEPDGLFGTACAPFALRIADPQAEEAEAQTEESGEAVRLRELLNLDESVCYDAQTRDYLERVFSSDYPHAANAGITGKLSVSELKRLSRSEEDDVQELYREETVIPLIPNFRQTKEPLSGAARGTVYHAFMENLDFSRKEELEIQLEEMITCGKMSGEEASAIRLEDIRAFLRTSAGQRMGRAAARRELFRERPFVLGIPASAIREVWSPDETVLVQGIIDAYFIEDGQITVLDYKTDRVGSLQELAGKYRAQLDYYGLALERLTGMRVKEKLIYSFHLGEEITL